MVELFSPTTWAFLIGVIFGIGAILFFGGAMLVRGLLNYAIIQQNIEASNRIIEVLKERKEQPGPPEPRNKLDE